MVFKAIARSLFGSVNERVIKSLAKYVNEINAFEPQMMALSDQELASKTEEFRQRLAGGAELDDLMTESFAVVREASRRVLGLRHFDVQLMGGIVQHRGMISEMRTGEGKTLVATLPSYLNALTGRGVHIITVNDYLAKRDSEWNGEIFKFLGLTVGCLTHDINENERYEAYRCDITYGTNNEFGFDYLRDNMKYSIEHFVQRPFYYAIVDEVDSILIDEARTPLIISGPTEDNSELYAKIDLVIRELSPSDYDVDEKAKTATLTDDGINNTESLIRAAGLMSEESSLFDMDNVSVFHHVNQALKAHMLFKLDVDYMLNDGKVMIIDEFTGRIMEGRRYSDGLHQALEAKEGVAIQNENQTLASITFQNYFRLYQKLAGMTGTAMTEANEFRDIYKLEVVEIPTNVVVARKDEDDTIFLTVEEKFNAVVEEIKQAHEKKQPVLVGTVSIEKSEHLSRLLKVAGIEHKVLNAKYHETEAHIIAQAGMPGAVTIATNMAGRGTDIRLGGNPEMMIQDLANQGMEEEMLAQKIEDIKQMTEAYKQEVITAGGLYVIGTERHESRRVDNQLRGRSGRQGDPGRTKFYLSMEDDLMRIFGSEKMSVLLQRLGMKKGEVIFHPMINKALEKAQQRVEGFNYDLRKNILKYDDVMNNQRKIIYEQRVDIIQAQDVSDTLEDMYREVADKLVNSYIPSNAHYEEWDIEGLSKEIDHIFNLSLPIEDWAKTENIDEKDILERILAAVDQKFMDKNELYGEEIMRMAKKRFLLITIDQLWKEHLYALDQLKQGINLRAYGQRDPLNEYKKEAFGMFSNMLDYLQRLYVERMSHLEISVNSQNSSVLSEDYKPQPKMHESRDGTISSEEDQNTEGLFRSRVAKEDRNQANPDSWGRVGAMNNVHVDQAKNINTVMGRWR